jgi:hypothetical protein
MELAIHIEGLTKTFSRTGLLLRRSPVQTVTAVVRYFPWDAKCLAQAVAGKWMLRRRGLPSSRYLDIDHGLGDEAWLVAHAWLRCGTEFVTGEPQHERFTVLAAYSEDRL